MKIITKILTKTLPALLLTLTSGIAAFAQETDDVSTTTPTSAYSWAEIPDQNPFPPPTITDGFGEVPQLIDFDGDGDLDAFDSKMYFKNIGTRTQPVFDKPIHITQFFEAGLEALTARFADMDGDNDWDAFLITSQPYQIKFYENIGTLGTPLFEERTGAANPLADVSVGLAVDASVNLVENDVSSTSVLNIIDIDQDGDLDIFFGYQINRPFQYYENTGNSHQPVFEKRTDQKVNPLREINTNINISYLGIPTFADIDSDGDKDVFITTFSGDNLVYYENTGNTDQPKLEERTADAHPLNQIFLQYNHSIGPIELVDIDNDNDLDIFMGMAGRPMLYYENIGDSFQFVERGQIFEEPGTVDVGSHSVPSFVDIDNDGDQDAFIINSEGFFSFSHYYENIGNAHSPQFVKRTDTANPLYRLFLSTYTHPIHENFVDTSVRFVDIDHDGDWDFFSMGPQNRIHFFENVGSATRPQFFMHPEHGLSGINTASVRFVDIDSDGDQDVLMFEYNEPIRYYENTGTKIMPNFKERIGSTNPFNGVRSEKIAIDSIFADIDHDGDLDAFLESGFRFLDPMQSRFSYYENTGNPRNPVFEKRTGEQHPFNDHEQISSLHQLVDIDNDGDLDAFAGQADGTLKYYQNTTTSRQTNFKKSTVNPLASMPNIANINLYSFADLDNDQDWDAFLGNFNIEFYENIGHPNNPLFVDGTINDHALAQVNRESKSIPHLADLDNDGDFDAIIGSEDRLRYYENLGNASIARFEEASTNPFNHITDVVNSYPVLVDIDQDGDLDLFVGYNGNGVRYFENTGNAQYPTFEEQHTANPLAQTAVLMDTKLCFVDIDHDFDLDVFIVYFSGYAYNIAYFENTGHSSQPQFEERQASANPLAMVQGLFTALEFVDSENDGDWDAVIGNFDGTLTYYENTGNANAPIFAQRIDHPVASIDVSLFSAPHFADIDNDKDWDLLAGDINGRILYYKNTGTVTKPAFENQSRNPLQGFEGQFLNFLDWDHDMDTDLFMFDIPSAKPLYYENIGDSSHPKFLNKPQVANALPFVSHVNDSTKYIHMPTFVDLDNDADWDFFTQEMPAYNGQVAAFGNVHYRYYENTGKAEKMPQFVERVGTANPLDQLTGTALYFVDIDQDGDLDCLMNQRIMDPVTETYSNVAPHYYENMGQAAKPTFVRNNAANPFNDIDVTTILRFVDLDNDGDQEVFLLDSFFSPLYYINTSAKEKTLPDRYALPKGGRYSQGREINLGCLVDCTNIYYTLDGSQLTTDSLRFTAPFKLTETTTLKFFTVDAKGNASEVMTEHYLIDTQPPEISISWPYNKQVLLKIGSLGGTVADPENSAGLDRIELQIHNGPLYLTGNTADPFSTNPQWFRLPLIPRGKQWFYNLKNVPLPGGAYTITARAVDKAGYFAEDTITVVKVEQAPSDLFLELSSATLLNDATLNAKGSLVSRRFPAVPETLAGLPIELTITSPDGSTETHTTEILTDIGQYEFNELSSFTLEGTYTLQTRFAGNDLLTSSASAPQTVLVGESAGYAILIQGRIENEEGLESHNKTTNRIYQTLKERGFEDANIFYFNPNLDQDGIEIDGPPTVADFVTIEEMQNRINGSPAPFYMIMVDHGDRGGNFYINDVDLEYVTPEIWAWWLDELESGLKDLSKPRIIMLGHCYSGKSLEMLSKPGRIIIASAAAKEESFKGPREPDGIRGGEYFMDELFKALARGDSFRDAFQKSADKTNEYTDRGGNRFINIVNDFGDESVQHPLIDINGDGQGSHELQIEQNAQPNPSTPEPLYNLADIYLGAGADYDTNYAGNPADIRSVADTIYLSPEQTAADLYLTVNEVLRVKEAAVNVRLPSTELKPADTSRTGSAEQREITELVEINLLCDFSQRCQRLTDEVAPDLFTEPGKYSLYYFVVDNETDNMSPVHRSVVYKTKANNGAPSPFDLLAPEDMATTEAAITFDWETGTDPEKEPMTYTLVIAEDADFHNVVYQQSDLRDSELTIDSSTVLADDSKSLHPGSTYYWTVEAVDFFGARTAASEVRIFRTESE